MSEYFDYLMNAVDSCYQKLLKTSSALPPNPLCIWQGKTIIPFCTHEGSGLSGTENKLKSVCKGSTVLEGLAVRGTTAQNKQEQARQSVKNWLHKLKY